MIQNDGSAVGKDEAGDRHKVNMHADISPAGGLDVNRPYEGF